MNLSIQRPPEAAAELVHRFANTLPPMNAQLIVAADEVVVVMSNGAALGVAPPGTHWLHPQPFPFLAPALVGGSSFRVELWFVKTVPIAGVQFGGSLPSVREPGTKVMCACRAFGDFALVVRDPARLVTACVGASMTETAALLGWVKQSVLRQFGSAFAKEVEGGKSVQSPALVPAVLDRVAGELGELETMGLGVSRFGDATVSVSEGDMAALRDAKLQAALEAHPPKPASAGLRCGRCSKPHDGGRFCVDCGGGLVSA